MIGQDKKDFLKSFLFFCQKMFTFMKNLYKIYKVKQKEKLKKMET